MRAWIIFNPAAGQRDLREAIARVADVLRSRDWSPAVHETTARGDATRLARAAADSGADALFVAGGDGTLNEALNGLAHSQTALGVLPAGTANVWAQEIGLPMLNPLAPDPTVLAACAKMQIEGDVRSIDLGRVGTRYYMLYASVGFDAHIVHQMEALGQFKRRAGALAYYVAAAAAAWTFRGVRARIRVDGRLVRRRIWAVMAANTQLYGGVIRFASEACADDGLLDVVIIEGPGLLAAAWNLIGYVRRGVWPDPRVRILRGQTIEVRTARPMPVQLDGDPFGVGPAQFDCVPAALRVLVPRNLPQRIFRNPAVHAFST
ncbi:MAG: diacylglycerol kinase family lipid kinase [Chloroflexi bacterium]|nr:diacylglycerol kinase family lipid kinase [Chloroflexota bacterium]